MKKIVRMAAITILLGGLTLAPVSLPSACGGCSPTCGVASVHAAESRTVDLALEGLTCTSCKFAVSAALKRLDGVERVDVSYEDRRAGVVYDPGKVTPRQLVEAVNNAGFRANVAPLTEGR